MDFFKSLQKRNDLLNENHMQFSMPMIPSMFRGGMRMEDAFPKKNGKYHSYIYNIYYSLVL